MERRVEARLHVASSGLRGSSESRQLRCIVRLTRTLCMFNWYVFLFRVCSVDVDLLQADEAYCIGPAPSTESYVSVVRSACTFVTVR